MLFMKLIKNKQNPENLTLLVVFIVLSLFIFLESYVANFYISPDSANYLRAAESISRGNWLWTDREVGIENYFVTWPAGYPLAIAIVSIITGLEVYLASKILNIILLGILLLLLKSLFKKKFIYSLFLLLNPGLIEIILYTWSELMFITIGIAINISLIRIYKSNGYSLINQIYLILLSLSLFLTRYIGMYVIALLVMFIVTSIYMEKLHIKKTVVFALTTLIALSGMVVYLYVNYSLSGTFTGGRISAYESIPQYVFMVIYAFLIELRNLILLTNSNSSIRLVIALLTVLFLIVIINLKSFLNRLRTIRLNKTNIIETNIDGLIFFTSGIIYFASIIFLRGVSYFDSLGPRLMLPGTVQIFIGLMLIITRYYIYIQNIDQLIYRNGLILILVFFTTYYLSIPFGRLMNSYIQNGEIVIEYKKEEERVLSKFAGIEGKSIVITDERNVTFLRTDLIISRARGISVQEFIEIYGHESIKIYVDTINPPRIVEGGIIEHSIHHKSFISIFRDPSNKSTPFVELLSLK